MEDIVQDLSDSDIKIEAKEIVKMSKPSANLCSYKISVLNTDLQRALNPYGHSEYELESLYTTVINLSNQIQHQRIKTGKNLLQEGVSEIVHNLPILVITILSPGLSHSG